MASPGPPLMASSFVSALRLAERPVWEAWGSFEYWFVILGPWYIAKHGFHFTL